MEIQDKMISKAIISNYMQDLLHYLETDVAIVGGGPAGLTAAYYLAKDGIKTAIFERRSNPGGGMWAGGIMFNHIVFQEEVRPILEELELRHTLYEAGYYTADAIETVCALTLKAIRAGAKIFNLMTVEDVMVREERVAGLVLNWTPVKMARLHVDPIAVEAKYVIDGTGHDAEVVNFLRKNKIELPTASGGIEGEASMWADRGEKETVERAGEVYPGLFVVGMSGTAVFGTHRMGPIFGGMLLGGKKVADMIRERL
ncbi:MAG: sulfide-dependent adenosine diphosphate thiazole synthase [bacterium]|nr:thiazole biosynthesis protein [Bacillota bacterium]